MKTVLIGLVLLSSVAVTAQERISFQPMFGYGLSYVSKKNTEVRYEPRPVPSGGVAMIIPAGSDLSIRTGIFYQQKGWRSSFSAVVDTGNMSLHLSSNVKMHELATPLQLYYETKGKGCFQYYVAGGMMYGFLLSAYRNDVIDVYDDGNYQQSTTINTKPVIGLFPDNSRLKKADGTTYFMFNAAARIDGGISWKRRYVLNLFWEHGLHNLLALDETTTILKMGSCGLMLGVHLR